MCLHFLQCLLCFRSCHLTCNYIIRTIRWTGDTVSTYWSCIRGGSTLYSDRVSISISWLRLGISFNIVIVISVDAKHWSDEIRGGKRKHVKFTALTSGPSYCKSIPGINPGSTMVAESITTSLLEILSKLLNST